MRKIFLQDGTGMGDFLYLFETNAPVVELKKLEKISCDAYTLGAGYDDVPIWAEELERIGYIFNYIDECQNISAYSSRNDLIHKYPCIKEFYTIENQPYIH